MTTRHGVNSIEMDGKPYLLAVISGSHLVPEALSDEQAWPAVSEWLVEMGGDWQLGYDMSELTAERWRSTTLCGREWLEMRAGDGPPIASTSASRRLSSNGCWRDRPSVLSSGQVLALNRVDGESGVTARASHQTMPSHPSGRSKRTKPIRSTST